ncbi:hypothetical protein [Geoalkalibacter sp.]|uniref:hypothetical protein n=1 Tax=Geoalkalibacter sp. TaxID=3041440 RepID=UPI00272E0AAB|nr:hypothetical protein [Geoalkalibacter sp.]
MQIVAGLLLIMCGCASASASPLEQYCYEEREGQKVGHFSWILEATEPVRLRSIDDRQEHINLFTGDWESRSWRLIDQKKNTDLQVERREEQLVFAGTWQGQALSKTQAIDQAPWYQALSVALRRLVASDAGTLEFWMVRPDTLEVRRLRAQPQSLETIELDDVRHSARRIRITAVGVPTWLWHGDYWLRATDGVFLRYSGRSGPPGSPLRQIELIGEECLPARL